MYTLSLACDQVVRFIQYVDPWKIGEKLFHKENLPVSIFEEILTVWCPASFKSYNLI